MTPSNPCYRLQLDIQYVERIDQVLVFSKSGAMLLDGPDAHLVVQSILPLLDGTRTLSELLKAIPDVSPEDITHLLNELLDHGLAEKCECRRLEATSEMAPEHRPRVSFSGPLSWATLVAEALSTESVELLTEDLEGKRVPDIAVGVFSGQDVTSLQKFASHANERRVRSLTCALYEREVVIGPLTVPGRSPCGNCGRMRLAANARWNESSPTFREPVRGPDRDIAAILAKQICIAVAQDGRGSGLENKIVILNRSSMGTSVHRILGVPGCNCCGGPTLPTNGAGDRNNNLSGLSRTDLAVEAVSWLVDSRTGIVNHIEITDFAKMGIKLPIVATAVPADTPDESPPTAELHAGWGKGLTHAEAILSALGETMERYASSIPDRSRIKWSRPNDLDGEVLDPRMFALYEEDQYSRAGFPFVRFDPQVSHPWVLGKWAGSRRPVWVPAILTYLSLVACKEHVFCQGSSNGLAAGTDSDEAALRAILELLERDAFLTHWRKKTSGVRIHVDKALDPDLKVVISGIGALGGQVELILLESICGYPTALCLAFGDGVHWPGVTIGLATDPNPRTAFRQAIVEQGQAGLHIRHLMKTRARVIPATRQDVKEMLDHASYYIPQERAVAFQFLRDCSHACSLDDIPSGAQRSLATCEQALVASRVRVALIDVTSGDLATTPFRVMRAVSPDLQSISFGYGLDRLPVPHLKESDVGSSGDDISPIW